MHIAAFIISLFAGLISFFQGGCATGCGAMSAGLGKHVGGHEGARIASEGLAIGGAGFLVIIASLTGIVGGSLALMHKKSSRILLIISIALCALALLISGAAYIDAVIWGIFYLIAFILANLDYKKYSLITNETATDAVIPPVHDYIPPVHDDTLPDEIPALDDINDETQARESSAGIEIIRRGFEALEHSNFDEANTFFNRAFPYASTNPAVYIGLLMSEYRIKKVNELVDIPILIENDILFQEALEYSNPELRKKLTRYVQVNAIKMRLSEIQ